jgi:hypothetical protein
MDMFHPMFAAINGKFGDYTVIYPSFNFVFLKFVHFISNGPLANSPYVLRDQSLLTVSITIAIYLILIFFSLFTKLFSKYSLYEKISIFLVYIFSSPFLFALERGNLLILSIFPLILLMTHTEHSKINFFSFAFLVNIKTYFILFIYEKIINKKYHHLFICLMYASAIFIISNLLFSADPFVFIKNTIMFAKNTSVFSGRELLSFPSSVSAFSHVLYSKGGGLFKNFYYLIEVIKFSLIIFSLYILFLRKNIILRKEFYSVIVVIICNLGIWVGGYTFIYYLAIFPVLYEMKFMKIYLLILAIIFLPIHFLLPNLDFFYPIGNNMPHIQYSYFSGMNVIPDVSINIASIVRPIVNFLLLFILSYEFYQRKTYR